MNQRFDPKKLTLTTFKPDAFRNATSKLSLEQKAAVPPSPQSDTDAVPEGRTTLRLNKLRGVVAAPANEPQPDPSTPPPTTTHSTIRPPTAKVNIPQSPSSQSSSISQPAPSPKTTSLSLPPQPTSPDTIATNPSESLAQDSSLPDQSTQPIFDAAQQSPTQDERTAALHTKAIRARKPKSAPLDPNDLVAFNTRQPKWLKDAFFKACAEKSTTPSLVVRNLMKSYCSLSLILFIAVLFSAHAAKDTTYTTEQLLSYFYAKTFGIKSVVPDLKSSVAVRHSLWQTGAQDSTDYIYADHSNTRLEAKVEIPILDFKYLKDRTKDKDELRAFVMKSLSKILAAQKAVDVLQNRAVALNTRLDYLRNQVTLKLVNKSDLFPVEDSYFGLQSQLFEAQSTLEQRIIDLAVIAGNDWLTAYRMIVKWDAKLFDQM